MSPRQVAPKVDKSAEGQPVFVDLRYNLLVHLRK
jgi:hypothetical protein